MNSIGPLTLHANIERWPLKTPFRITGYTWETADLLVVSLHAEGRIGRGEAAGVYYKKETPASMLAQINNVRARVEAGIDRLSLQQLLPPGGARNALDCALWDLEAKLTGQPAWRTAGLREMQPLRAAFTIGADEPESMAATARTYPDNQAIKLKLTGEQADAARVLAVREVRPHAWLSVDANQGFSRASFERILPVLQEANIALIEQPFPIGQDALLDGLDSPIPVAADESVQGLADIASLVGRFDVVNIKLDKCGGLTEGLAMARAALDSGLTLMVGNMLGTSLAMAPGFLLGQLCSVVDLDGPIALASDRDIAVRYGDGLICCPAELWGQ
jgi:L-alanine-DL-glutamate epimerase-like enolase superfamily enzyme